MDDFKYQIIDNYLPEKLHKTISDQLIGWNSINFPWYLANNKSADSIIMDKESIYNFQFVHMFFIRHQIFSTYFENIIGPFLAKIQPMALIRVKANLNPIVSQEKAKYGWHTDYTEDKGLKKGYKTAVYYVNDNNGKTYFKNGLEVDAVANRMVIFDGWMEHTGESCTDQKYRCLINFNYVE
jgi:hypothetical protein